MPGGRRPPSAAATRRARSRAWSRSRPSTTTVEVSRPTAKRSTSSSSAANAGWSVGRSERRSIDSSRRDSPQAAAAVNASASSTVTPGRATPLRTSAALPRPNHRQAAARRPRGSGGADRWPASASAGAPTTRVAAKMATTPPAITSPISRTGRKWASDRTRKAAAVVATLATMAGPVSRPAMTTAAPGAAPPRRAPRKRLAPWMP